MKIKLIKYLDAVLGRLLIYLLSRPEGDKPCPPQSVLLIRPGGIGDAALLVPSILSLKSAFPDAVVDVLAERRNFKVFELCSWVDSLFCYDRFSDLRQVLTHRYDVVIDTEQWHRLSAVVVRLIRSERKIGFGSNERARLFTDVVDYSHDDYEEQSFLNLLFPMLPTPEKPLSSPYLHVPASVKSPMEILGSGNSAYIVFFHGASIDERRWGGARFAELAIKVIALGFEVVVVGGAEDVSVAEDIGARVPSVISMAGKTSLLETASLLKGATLLVSGDSGVLHIAVGLDVRTISLFGPGIAKKWAPRGGRHAVINHQLPCSPCTKFGNTPKCKIGARCIQEISVDEVFSAVKAQLACVSDEGIVL